MYFLHENQWFGGNFYGKTEGSMHDDFCYAQHVENLFLSKNA